MGPTSRHFRREMEATVAKSDSKDNLKNYHFIMRPIQVATLAPQNSSPSKWKRATRVFERARGLAMGTANLLDISAKNYPYLRNAHHRGAGQRRELVSVINAHNRAGACEKVETHSFSIGRYVAGKSTGLRVSEIYQFQDSYASAAVTVRRLVSRSPDNILREGMTAGPMGSSVATATEANWSRFLHSMMAVEIIIRTLHRFKVVRYRRAEMLPSSCKIRVGKIRGLGEAWWHIGSSILHDKFEVEIS
ncbi:hypothetical protein F4604DRAFT_1677992 [Suillus subluteus]|nr:hypothetical protein F4604DRAFT_1677992 [Suillus subluteus]